MASPTVILAIIRAARPKFRSRHDRLAFAIHAYMLAKGYKLVAVGKKADEIASGKAPASEVLSTEEVDVAGWQDMEDGYAFFYVDSEGKRPAKLLKMVPSNSHLLVQGINVGQDKEPQLLELDVNEYTKDTTDLTEGYVKLDELLAKLSETFVDEDVKKAVSDREERQPAEAQPRAPPPVPGPRDWDPAHDPLRIGPVRGGGRGPAYVPRPIGSDDVVPPGFRPPGMPTVPGIGGLPAFGPDGMPGPGMPRGPDGGMVVGPDSSLFGGRPGIRPRGGEGLGGMPPGGRWDPIGPPGMQGFHPEDFRRGFGGQGYDHPDLEPRRGGSSYDHMFG